MRPSWGILALSIACTGQPEDDGLLFDGPVRVSVDHLGPVPAPTITRLDGSPADGLEWSAPGGGVAEVRDNQIFAIGPGEAEILGRWEGVTVTWTLLVAPAVTLRFVEPPHALAVGAAESLVVQAAVGDAPAEVSGLVWSAKPDSVLRVDGAGQVTALGPGIGWVTAASGRAEAVVEIRVE